MKRIGSKVSILSIALLALLFAFTLAGCTKFEPGNPLAEQEVGGGSPEEAVQQFFLSMENKDFDTYIKLVPPAFLEGGDGQPIPDEDLQKLKENWESDQWEAKFMAIELKLNEEESNENHAVVEVVGGQVRYIGKDMFNTNEYKVDDFKDKPGRIVLDKVEGTWKITGGGELGDEKEWQTPPAE